MNTPVEQLALHGGTPMLPGGPPAWPRPDAQVQAALEAAYASGDWGRYHGPYCGRFAERLAEYHGVEHVMLCCSGTLAVELALRALGIGGGDEVLLAGYDFPGNFRAIEAIGAAVALVDVDPHNWSFDPRHMEQAISPSTRAVVASHLHGGVVPISRLMEIARRHGLSVVEDACQAPGAVVEGRPAGTWGDVGVLSFGGSKLLTAGRGGALLMQSAEVHQRAKVFAERGNSAFPLSELQAAVLIPQLAALDERNARRAANVARLHAALGDVASLLPVVNHAPHSQAAYYKVAWRWVTETADGLDRERLIAAVRAEGVALNAGFRGFDRRGPRRCRKVGPLVNSRAAAEGTVLLHHPVLLESGETIDTVAAAIRKVVLAFA